MFKTTRLWLLAYKRISDLLNNRLMNALKKALAIQAKSGKYTVYHESTLFSAASMLSFLKHRNPDLVDDARVRKAFRQHRISWEEILETYETEAPNGEGGLGFDHVGVDVQVYPESEDPDKEYIDLKNLLPLNTECNECPES